MASPEGTSTRRLLDERLGSVGLDPKLAVVSAQRDAILPLVLAGAGAALVLSRWPSSLNNWAPWSPDRNRRPSGNWPSCIGPVPSPRPPLDSPNWPCSNRTGQILRQMAFSGSTMPCDASGPVEGIGPWVAKINRLGWPIHVPWANGWVARFDHLWEYLVILGQTDPTTDPTIQNMKGISLLVERLYSG